MIFNGIRKPYIHVLSGRVRPFFAPLIRSSKFDSRLVQTERGHRIIEVPVYIKFKSLSEFRRLTEDIAAWLVHDEPKPLEFADEPDRLYFAIVDDTVNEETLYLGGAPTVFRFICGHKYSKERQLTINNTLSTNIKGHKSTFWRTRTVFSSNQTNYEIVFAKLGAADFRNIGKVRLNYNFIPGDVLEIDYLKRKVTLNGNDITNTVVVTQTNFMELPIGTVNFLVSHPTQFFYHERYH